MTSQLASGDLISDRYASALYDLASEKKLVDPVLSDLSLLKKFLPIFLTGPPQPYRLSYLIHASYTLRSAISW